ncbi:MAG: hypothetical protein NVSMB5_06230 [Candidatus Velthaea sp.]
MNRFNFIAVRRPMDFTIDKMTVPPRLREPAGALAATAALVTVLYGIQTIRLQEASERHGTAVARLARSEAAIRHFKMLDAEIARRSRLAAAVIDVQRSGVRRANELAWIGNRLPSETWLSSIRVDAGSYALEGGSERVAAVGAAMQSLRGNPTLGTPQLQSVTDDASAASSRVRYALRLESARP